MEGRIKAAIIGPGNIGTDLMYKILNKSKFLELQMVAGIYKDSKGLMLAEKEGILTSTRGIDAILEREDIAIVFDATSAKAHQKHAPLLEKMGKIAVDLTPAAVGPYVVPVVNMEQHLNAPNINLITCGGQATIPIVKAISRVVRTFYAEIVATIASKSAGPGTRQNIDEFTMTTAKGIVTVGGAEKGKAIILLNPADPPIMMNNTIYARVEEARNDEISTSIESMVKDVQRYVPGYRLKMPPVFEDNKVTVMVEVEGAGDYLPKYSGNLDIQTSAALAIGEKIAANMVLNKRQEGVIHE